MFLIFPLASSHVVILASNYRKMLFYYAFKLSLKRGIEPAIKGPVSFQLLLLDVVKHLFQR